MTVYQIHVMPDVDREAWIYRSMSAVVLNLFLTSTLKEVRKDRSRSILIRRSWIHGPSLCMAGVALTALDGEKTCAHDKNDASESLYGYAVPNVSTRILLYQALFACCAV